MITRKQIDAISKSTRKAMPSKVVRLLRAIPFLELKEGGLVVTCENKPMDEISSIDFANLRNYLERKVYFALDEISERDMDYAIKRYYPLKKITAAEIFPAPRTFH